ncbi:helix-turn-helix domain-containing protein [Sinorhizobium meliloti]|nr:helix-turn-helix domain-containing protein [Sinorhizobium meliloti]MDW9484613.1 helix-turn-helix domain-containing protein [Sinorhizobium meliloti]MDW9603510.1 helix-turn-helix domain-containing protein [Sinorhizobium meliloti]MDW9671472.1 helix-turn-helix domain-containing protein [Sinorhizobium meliloti]MDW9777296.1 helix-turn-helix domain-containing protein [Sinorhizobium meliloti]
MALVLWWVCRHVGRCGQDCRARRSARGGLQSLLLISVLVTKDPAAPRLRRGEEFFQPKDLGWLDPCDKVLAGDITDGCSGRWLTRHTGLASEGYSMPCREVSTMGERREFVRLPLEEGVNRRELCRRFGISPDIRCKWLARWEAGDGELADRSRRPRISPMRCNEAVEAEVLAMRDAHRAWGTWADDYMLTGKHDTLPYFDASRGRPLLQMPLGIHPAMQDADDVDPVAAIPKIDDVRSCRVFEITRSHIDIAAFLRPCGQSLKCSIKLVLVGLRLFQRPAASLVAPYLPKVGLGGRSEPERPFSRHIRRAFRL